MVLREISGNNQELHRPNRSFSKLARDSTSKTVLSHTSTKNPLQGRTISLPSIDTKHCTTKTSLTCRRSGGNQQLRSPNNRRESTCATRQHSYISLGREFNQSALQHKAVASLPPLDKADKYILRTDPRRTKALWGRVMSQGGARKGTKASLAKIALRQSKDNATTVSGDSSSNPTAQSVNTAVSKRSIAARPMDKDFEIEVLAKRGIFICSDQPSGTAFPHFGTSPPTTDLLQHYREFNQDTLVWLDMDEETARRVVRAYLYMRYHHLCEAEYATYAKENFLKGDIRDLEPDPHRLWKTQRMIELVAKPDNLSKWRTPPEVDSKITGKRYEFDIRPDCSYWLSIQAFNPQYKDQIEEWTCVMHESITCPYFTVEFKRDDSDIAVAKLQVAAASALALYNRFLLKQACLDVTGKKWSSKAFNQLRHYGLTFTGEAYAFWCTTPIKSDDWSWKGCRMERVFQSKCSHEIGLKNFVDWINEIHRWGLTVHGKACEADLRLCIHKNSHGIRTSLGEGGDALAESDEDEGVLALGGTTS